MVRIPAMQPRRGPGPVILLIRQAPITPQHAQDHLHQIRHPAVLINQ